MQVIQTRSGAPTLKIGERLLHSGYDPVREARREIESLARDNPSAVVILGGGLGYAADAALEILPRARVIVVEADPEIHATARRARPLASDPRVTYVVGRNEVANFAALSAAIDVVAMSCVRYVSRLADLDPAFYAGIVETIGRISSMQLEGIRSTLRFGPLWWENSVRSYREWAVRPDVSAWFGAYRSSTVFVFAAGPTLRDHLELFAGNPGGLRFCVDTAYPVLREAGVRVDAVFAIDAQEMTLRHFDRHAPGLLVAVPVVPPALWRRAAGGVLMSLGGPHFDWFDEVLKRPVARLKSGGSVTTFAFDLARRMAPERIVLVGADFAHRRGRRHAPGTTYEELDAAVLGRFRTQEIAGYRNRVVSGGVDTEEQLVQYAQWMRWEIRETDCPVMRMSDFGLLAGVPVMTREEALRILDAASPRFFLPPDRPADARSLVEAFKVERTSLSVALAGEEAGFRSLSGFFDPIVRPFAVASQREAIEGQVLEDLLARLRRAAEVLDEVIESARGTP